MKTIHDYSEKLERELNKMTEDELMKWFETNTITYERDLLEVIEGERE